VGLGRFIERQQITLSHTKLSLNGWYFKARIEHLCSDDGTLNLIYTAPNETVDPKYTTVESNCEHCRVKRSRNSTFLVGNASDQVMQVGSSCLGDFMRSAELLGLADSLLGSDESGEAGGTVSHTASIKEVLGVAAAVITGYGYLSVVNAEMQSKVSTATTIRNYLFSKNSNPDEIIEPKHFNEVSAKLAADTFRYLEELADRDLAELTDYERNLAVLMRVDYCPCKAIGILGSSVLAFQRTQTKKVEVQRTIKFIDRIGNLYVWYASSNVSLEIGTTYDVIATVKKHDTDSYSGGVPITVLTRVVTDLASVGRQRTKAVKAKKVKQVS